MARAQFSRSHRRASKTRTVVSCVERLEDRRLLVGNLGFEPPAVYENHGLSASIIAGDVNLDGILDLLDSTHRCCGQPTLLLGKGEGAFVPTRLSFTNIAFARFADVNNDGYPDIVAPDGGEKALVVSVNRGVANGEWLGFGDLRSFEITGASRPQRVVLGHFDDDHLVDVAVADNTFVWVLLNRGFENDQWDGYDVLTSYDTGPFPLTMEAADLDADGKLDLVVGDLGNGDISILIGDGDGQFDHVEDYEMGSDFALQDFDNDGQLDMLASHGADLLVRMGNGDGTFQAASRYQTSIEPIRGVTTGDLDGDGDSDIIAFARDSSDVRLLKNDGEGRFPVELDWPVGPDPGFSNSAVVEDLDDDGDLDFVVTTNATTQQGRITNVFLNDRNVGVAGSSIGTRTLSPTENLAPQGIASQSTEASSSRLAQYAIDGDKRTRSETSRSAQDHWWQVDLRGTFPISRIALTGGRGRLSLNRGGGVLVQVFDDSGEEVWSRTVSGDDDIEFILNATSETPVVGSLVRVSKREPVTGALRLQEVEVFSGDTRLDDQQTLVLDINADEGTADQVRAIGTLHIDGAALQLRLEGGPPAAGTQFHVIDAPSMEGFFDQLLLPDLPDELVWNTSKLYSDGRLSVNGAGPDGDFDGDGEVGFADFVLLASTFGQRGEGLPADANGDGSVDFDDFVLLSTNYGKRIATA